MKKSIISRLRDGCKKAEEAKRMTRIANSERFVSQIEALFGRDDGAMYYRYSVYEGEYDPSDYPEGFQGYSTVLMKTYLGKCRTQRCWRRKQGPLFYRFSCVTFQDRLECGFIPIKTLANVISPQEVYARVAHLAPYEFALAKGLVPPLEDIHRLDTSLVAELLFGGATYFSMGCDDSMLYRIWKKENGETVLEHLEDPTDCIEGWVEKESVVAGCEERLALPNLDICLNDGMSKYMTVISRAEARLVAIQSEVGRIVAEFLPAIRHREAYYEENWDENGERADYCTPELDWQEPNPNLKYYIELMGGCERLWAVDGSGLVYLAVMRDYGDQYDRTDLAWDKGFLLQLRLEMLPRGVIEVSQEQAYDGFLRCAKYAASEKTCNGRASCWNVELFRKRMVDE